MGDFDLFALTAQPRFLVFLFVQAVVAFACFAAIIGLRFLRRGAARFWIGPALVATSVLPGVVATLFTAFAFRDVLAGVVLTGFRGTSALAAGSMESLLPLVVGLVCVAGLSVLALVVVAAGTSRVDEQAAPGGTTVRDARRPSRGRAGPVPRSWPRRPSSTAWASEASSRRRSSCGGASSTFGAVAAAVALAAFAVVTVLRAPRSRAPLLAKVLPPLSLLAVALGSAVTWAAPLRLDGPPRGPRDAGPPAVASADPAFPGESEEEAPSPEPAPEPEKPPAPEQTPSAARPTREAAVPPTTRPRPAATRAAPQAPSAVRVGGSIKEPRKLKNVTPVYPQMAKQARVQGIVILECTIGPDGRVQEVRSCAASSSWTRPPSRPSGSGSTRRRC